MLACALQQVLFCYIVINEAEEEQSHNTILPFKTEKVCVSVPFNI